LPLLGKRRKQEIRDKRVGEGVEKDLNLDNLNLPSSNLGSVASLLPTGWANSKTKLLQTVIDDVYGALSKICNVVAKSEWTLHKTSRNQAHVDSYLRKVWAIAKSIDAQAFPFRPWSETFGNVSRGWWCSPKYCSAWNICEGKHLPDDLVEETPIDITAGWQ